jgi:LysM repeat protein
MNKRSPAPARFAAVAALVLAAIVLIVAIGASLGGDSGSAERGRPKAAHKAVEKRHVPAVYEVQSGDTLFSIAHRTGVPVRTIEALNPQVDPQILIAGETLELR